MMLSEFKPSILQERIRNISLHSNIYEIAVGIPVLKIQRDLFGIKVTGFDEKIQELQKQLRHRNEQIKQLSLQLQKQKQLSYIMKGYFGKIERIMYNQNSQVFERHPPNYQQMQLHFREILRRIQDIHNNKLPQVPHIYRKDNIKIYRKIQVKHNDTTL